MHSAPVVVHSACTWEECLIQNSRYSYERKLFRFSKSDIRCCAFASLWTTGPIQLLYAAPSRNWSKWNMVYSQIDPFFFCSWWKNYLIDADQLFLYSPREKQKQYGLGSHLYRIKHELVLQWKTTPRIFNAETHACKRIMRVSPLDLRSSPSICLMKHILSDKVVTLITPDISTFQEGKPAKQGRVERLVIYISVSFI